MGSDTVLNVLEKHMFYKAGDKRKTPFDLAAFDDLLPVAGHCAANEKCSFWHFRFDAHADAHGRADRSY